MKALRPLLHTCAHQRAALSHLHPPQRRTFLPNPFSGTPFDPTANSKPQILTASRTLPYPSPQIYNIIADVSSYSSFLPYCQASSVTKWSSPDLKTQTRWPSEAKLVVGWGSITEEFTSRIFCVPGRVVEAIGGKSDTTLGKEEVAHHKDEKDLDGGRGRNDHQGTLLTHLLTRWTVQPLPSESPQQQHQTEVNLSIEFAFSSPIYSTLSAGAAPKVAEMMIKAFEGRVREILGKAQDNPSSNTASGGRMGS